MIEIIDTWLTWLSTGIFVMGAGIALLGDHFGMQNLVGGGIAGMGLASGLSGLESVVTRKANFVPWAPSGEKPTAYSGLSAILWGLLFIAFGGLLILGGLSIVFLPGGLDAAVQKFFETPLGWGFLVLGVGLVVTAQGVIKLLSGPAFTDPSYNTLLMDVGARIGGAVMIVVGALLTLTGVMIGLAPDLTKTLFLQTITGILSALP